MQIDLTPRDRQPDETVEFERDPEAGGYIICRDYPGALGPVFDGVAGRHLIRKVWGGGTLCRRYATLEGGR